MLLVVETTDVLFAVDSIPAVLAITLNAFIVYTSNVFAILGLRSMYFALAGMMDMFHYLHYGLSVVLIFIGAKNAGCALYRDPDGVGAGDCAAGAGRVDGGVGAASQEASVIHLVNRRSSAHRRRTHSLIRYDESS